MNNLNKTELEYLRHVINMQDVSYEKYNDYATSSVDPQIKQLFTKAAQEALNVKQKLMSFLV